MKYSRIVLEGYTRMRLNQASYFEMRLDSPLQLILGTNGCGKSSLLWELSPLPGSKDDFSPGGKKIIELEHRGRSYVLSSVFGSKQEHFFVCDGEELNKGHTITVQKDLVKEHFGLTTDIHALALGYEGFCSMPAARRKDWFLRLCDVNYDYALKVFTQLKNAHRDRVGALRLEKKALGSESERLLSDLEIEKINQETNWLHEVLNHLLEWRKPLEGDLDALDIESARLDKQLINQAQNLTRLLEAYNERELSDAQLQELLQHSQHTATQASTRLEMLANQAEQVKRKIQVLQNAGQDNVQSFEQQIKKLNEELDMLSTALMVPALDNPEHASAVFASIKQPLIEVLGSLPSNRDKRYSSASLQEARAQLENQNRIKSNTLDWLAEQKASLAHMREHIGKPDVTCPKCKHSFSRVYSESSLLALSQAVEKRQEELVTQIDPKLQELSEFVEECLQYASLYRQYVRIISNADSLKPYWDWLTQVKTITDNPESAPALIYKIESDLAEQLKRKHVLERLIRADTTLQQLISVGEGDLEQLQAQYNALMEQLEEQTSLLQQSNKAAEHYRNQLMLRNQMVSARSSIRKLIKSQQQILTQQVEYHRRSTLNQLIRDLQSALAQREQTLFAARRQRGVVDTLTSIVQRYTQEERALDALVKELSPTEGLIAEGLLGFIKNFCASMNELISKVWAYPLEIKSCEMIEGESVDLDYCFALLVGDSEDAVDDVSKGSEGMREIINLAFRITALQYLDMVDWPLYLDEVGRTFDKSHRAAAASLISGLIEQSSFPQIFMISHYENVYGALAGAQICVLNPTNITTPQVYNQHVITRT